MSQTIVLCEESEQKRLDRITTYTEFYSPSKMFDGESKDRHIILDAEVGEDYTSQIQLHFLYPIDGVDKHTATYSGLYIQTDFSGLRVWFNRFPVLMDNICIHGSSKDWEELGFVYREPTYMELLVCDGIFYRQKKEIDWKQLSFELKGE